MKTGALILCLVCSGALSAAPKLFEPLPIEAATSVRGHLSRSSFDLSPDGRWLAHSYLSDGVRETNLTSTDGKRIIKLGGLKSSTWSVVWSPDGQRVAFFSEEGSEAGLWVWERSTEQTTRFPGVIPRSPFGFEVVRWMADSQRLVCLILPEGVSVAQADADPIVSLASPDAAFHRKFPKVAEGEPSVLILSAPSKVTTPPKRPSYSNIVDLALLDLRDRSVTRVVRSGTARWYELSPDNRYLAYTSSRQPDINNSQPIFELTVYDVQAKSHRSLGTIHQGFGSEWSWSPNSESIAWFENGPAATGELNRVLLSDGSRKTLSDATRRPINLQGKAASLNRMDQPRWDRSGRQIYYVSEDGKLWSSDVDSGTGERVAEIPGRRIFAIVSRPEFSTIFTTSGLRYGWVLTEDPETQRNGLYRVDLLKHTTLMQLEEQRMYLSTDNLDASALTGEIAYVARDQQNPGDAWLFNTSRKRTRQLTHLNPAFEKFALGTARVVTAKGPEGQELKGALLVPPTWREGQRLPLVVRIYGGTRGADLVNRFGFEGHLAGEGNQQVLATRGYAVLYPDVPVRTGRALKDIFEATMPQVDALIGAGIVDPERLAIMGTSYGAYSTLAVITQTNRFKAAIITAAVTHPDYIASYLEMMPDGQPTQTGFFERGQGNIGGTPWEFPERYRANSPIYLFDKIETPLLIGQGSQDGRLIAPDAIFVALQRLGKTVEYRLYENEGHVMRRTPNVIDFWKRRIEFLNEHLSTAATSTP